MNIPAIQQRSIASPRAGTTDNLKKGQSGSVGLNISDKASEYREQSTVQFLEDSVQQRATDNQQAFRSALDQAYGGKADPAALDKMTAMAANGNLPLPENVVFVDAGTLGATALGAYDNANGGTIYLDRSLLNNPKALQSVYTEELGHHLDAQLGGPDAAGDEGAIFSRSLLQGKVDATALQALKSENDSGFIAIDGKQIAVEFNDYSGPGSSAATGGTDSPSSDSGKTSSDSSSDNAGSSNGADNSESAGKSNSNKSSDSDEDKSSGKSDINSSGDDRGSNDNDSRNDNNKNSGNSNNLSDNRKNSGNNSSDNNNKNSNKNDGLTKSNTTSYAAAPSLTSPGLNLELNAEPDTSESSSEPQVPVQPEENQLPAAIIGTAGAAGRENFIASQSAKAYDIGFTTSTTPYQDSILRAVPDETARVQGYANFTFSDKGGRYASPGETSLYNSDTLDGIKAEAAHYGGMANSAVVKSDFSGNVVDVMDSPEISRAALTEPYGDEGRDRSLASRLTGEDPYTHPRAFAAGARAQGAEGVRVPANESATNVNIFPENTRNLSEQYNYVEHSKFDASGEQSKTVFDSGVALPPDGSTPGVNSSNPGSFPDVQSADAKIHQRAGGARYGAAGATAFSTINALADDGKINEDESVAIARDAALGGGSAIASDALGNKLGAVRGGAVVDGIVAVGTSVWSNADAVEDGTMSAGDATADVAVDTGVAVAAGMAGMAVGATIGSAIPVAGTAVGAGAGFVVGAGAAWVASKTLEDFTNVADSAREGLGNILENNFEKPLKTVWDATGTAKDKVAGTASGIKNSVSDKLSNVKDSISRLFGGD